MTDRLVTPKTALLARGKGFDEYCEHVGAKVIKEHSRYHIEKLDYYEGREEVGKYRNAELPDEVEGYEFTVPSQSLLQKWLREIYEIDIIIEPAEDDNRKYYCWRARIKMKPATLGGIGNTFEEALEEGLQEALKLIKS